MQTSEFKTNRRLWIYFSLVVFVAFWFVPIIPIDGDTLRPCVCWIAILKTPTAAGGWAWKDGVDVLKGLPVEFFAILVMTLILSIPSAVAGWVLQGLVVLFCPKKMDGHDHVA